MKYVILIVLVMVAAGFVFRNDLNQYLIAGKTTEQKEEKGKKGKKEKSAAQEVADVAIVQKWELPEVLREVSGIAYVDEQRFACIQDEEGTIYIYNRATNEIEKEIPFAAPGDYEGITLNNNTAYVVRADGHLYEVPMNEGKKGVKEYGTPLTVEQNVEGLFYDKNGNRLLLAIKDDEPNTKDYKGVYAFDLSSNTFVKDPVFKIELKNPLLNGETGKKNSTIKPSEIAMHPATGDIYITDGPAARLLVMDANGKAKKLYHLGKDYPQAEGITFSPSGDLFISNEGKKRGTIIQTELR